MIICVNLWSKKNYLWSENLLSGLRLDNDSRGKLHRAAVERAMLDDYRTAVDADNLAVGEGVSDYSCCLGVEVGLGVGGIEHRSVDDEEIGVGGWQTFGTLRRTVEELLAVVIYRSGGG